MSYARAKETFFTHGSAWELNLPQRTLQQLLHPETPHFGPKSHPHPNALSEVRFEIDRYLNDSLTRYRFFYYLATRTLASPPASCLTDSRRFSHSFSAPF
jgi:hypothetical protein